MTDHFLCTKPRFTAKAVAKVIGDALGRKVAFEEFDESEDLDGSVEATNRVHVQVGADYLVISAWKDEFTLRCWPARSNIPDALSDLVAAVAEFPESPP
jgi:hypothetical protein